MSIVFLYRFIKHSSHRPSHKYKQTSAIANMTEPLFSSGRRGFLLTPNLNVNVNQKVIVCDSKDKTINHIKQVNVDQ